MTVRHYAYAFSADAFVASVNGDYGAGGRLRLAKMKADCAARLRRLSAEQRGFLEALRFDEAWFDPSGGGPECWVLVRLAEGVRALPSLSSGRVPGFDAMRRIGRHLGDAAPMVEDLVSGTGLDAVFARLQPVENAPEALNPPFMTGWLPRERVVELYAQWPRIEGRIRDRRPEMLELIDPVAAHLGIGADRLLEEILSDAGSLVSAARDAGTDLLLILD